MEFNEKEYIWNGHSIKYASVGSGEKGNIVLVHGFGGCRLIHMCYDDDEFFLFSLQSNGLKCFHYDAERKLL
jgi:pimeloyl-ACP methyl ester carboxylesterase